MVFIKHNSLKSGIFFNRIFIPGFSGSRFFRVQVFQGPGFSGSRSRVQGPGPGFRSSQNITGETFFLKKSHTKCGGETNPRSFSGESKFDLSIV